MKKLINLIVFILIAGLNGWAQEAAEVIRVACVGNSITFGSGIANRDRDSYPSVLGQMLGRGYEVRNFGFSARSEERRVGKSVDLGGRRIIKKKKKKTKNKK